MSIDLIAVSFDCADAARVAGFWAAVLDRKIADGATPESASIAVDDVATTGPLLLFHGMPEGKTVKNRLHLDLATTNPAAESTAFSSSGPADCATSPRTAGCAGPRSPTRRARSST
jgi:hypothetical protein